MRLKRGCAGAGRGAIGLSCLLIFCTGCAIFNGFLDPTKVGQFPLEYQERGIRRVLTPRDTPPGPAEATEPEPADLVVDVADYRLVPGDQLQITIDDLVRQGLQEISVQIVSDSGYIRIPRVGSVKVAGMTEIEVEQAIARRVAEAGILPDPIVRVITASRNGRVFSMLGSVNRPGTYPLSRPGLRLLDAIGLAGDVGADAREMYIIRRVDGATPAAALDEFAPSMPEPSAAEAEGLVIPPPTEGEDWSTSFSTEPTLVSAADVEPAEAGDDEALLEDVISGGFDAETTQPTQSTPAEAGFDPIVFDPETGQPVSEADAPAAPPPPAEDEPTAAPPPPVDEEFAWDDVPEYESSQRVIRIDVGALKGGDPRYNVVVRDRDVINVPIDTGVFYMMGEINRPGVFAFSGREITVKQAIALAGGFTPLAWPQRCEIIRREPGTDRQITVPIDLDAIFAGLEDDVLLRDEDILNVGTHLVSPFLFVIRNSFRFTYGFGFVYDRNFADIDAFSAKANPADVDRARRQQRGLPF